MTRSRWSLLGWSATALLVLVTLTPNAGAIGPGAGDPVHGPATPRAGDAVADRVAPGTQVQVAATVPTKASAVLAGRKVRRSVARSTVLQQQSATGWSRVAGMRADRSGAVAYIFAAPAATTSYRVLAPARRVKLVRKVHGHQVVKRVRLKAWTGPVETIEVDPILGQVPPSQQPSQQPGNQPDESPDPGPGLVKLLTPRSGGPLPEMTNLSSDASGRYVVFASTATDLAPGDDNDLYDVFLADTVAGTVTLVSHALDGTPGNGPSWQCDISADGRYVTFASNASDLVGVPTGGVSQVYLYDRVTGAVELVSVTERGVAGDDLSRRPSVSGDGRYVAFESAAENLTPWGPGWFPKLIHIVRHDRVTGWNTVVTTPRDNVWAGSSNSPSLSDDGTRVAFFSTMDGWAVGDGNGLGDVFLYDFVTGNRKRISRTPSGASLVDIAHVGAISGDGGTVVWSTAAPDVTPGDAGGNDNGGTDTFSYDVEERANTLVSHDARGRSLDAATWPAAVSADGSSIILRTTLDWDAGTVFYRYDATTDRLAPLWRSADGVDVYGQALSPDAAISADGRRVAFTTPQQLTEEDQADGTDVYQWHAAG